MLGLGLHHHPVAREAELVEALDETVGERLRRERGLVDTGRRRIELARLDEVGGRRRGRRGVLATTAREAVRVRAVEPEAAEHRRRGQRGEVTQGAQPESPQEIGEGGALVGPVAERLAEDGHRPRREERRGRARHDDRDPTGAVVPCSGAGREPCRERAVGDADPRVGRDLLVHDLPVHDLEDAGRELLVAAEVAGRAAGGERQDTGPLEHHCGGDRLHGAGDGLERPRLGRRVALDDDQARAARLGLAPADPDDDVFGARLARHRAHHQTTCAALHHHDGCRRERRVGATRGADRPGGAPAHERPLRDDDRVHVIPCPRALPPGGGPPHRDHRRGRAPRVR